MAATSSSSTAAPAGVDNQFVVGKDNSVVCITIPSSLFKTARPQSLNDIDLSSPGGRDIYRAVQFLMRAMHNPKLGSSYGSDGFYYFDEAQTPALQPKFTFFMEFLMRSPIGIKRLEKSKKPLHQYLLEENFPDEYDALEEYRALSGYTSSSSTTSSNPTPRDLTYEEFYHQHTIPTFHQHGNGGGDTAAPRLSEYEIRRNREVAMKSFQAITHIAEPNLCYNHVSGDVEMAKRTKQFWRYYEERRRRAEASAVPYEDGDDEDDEYYNSEAEDEDSWSSGEDGIDEDQAMFEDEFGEGILPDRRRRGNRTSRQRREQRLKRIYKIGTEDLVHEKNFAGVRLWWVVHDPNFNVMTAIQSMIFSNANSIVGRCIWASRKNGDRVNSRMFTSVDMQSMGFPGQAGFNPQMAIQGPLRKRKKKKKSKKKGPQQQRGGNNSFLDHDIADPGAAMAVDSDDEDDDEYDLFSGPGNRRAIAAAPAAAAAAPAGGSDSDSDDSDDDDDDDDVLKASFNDATSALHRMPEVKDADRFSDTICTYTMFAEKFVNVLIPPVDGVKQFQCKITDDLKTERYDIYEPNSPLHFNNWVRSGIGCWNAFDEPVCSAQTTIRDNYMREDISDRVRLDRGTDSNTADDVMDNDRALLGCDDEMMDAGSFSDDELAGSAPFSQDTTVVAVDAVVQGAEPVPGHMEEGVDSEKNRQVKAFFHFPFPKVPVAKLKPEEASWERVKDMRWPWATTTRFDRLATMMEKWYTELRRKKNEANIAVERTRTTTNTAEQDRELEQLNKLRMQHGVSAMPSASAATTEASKDVLSSAFDSSERVSDMPYYEATEAKKKMGGIGEGDSFASNVEQEDDDLDVLRQENTADFRRLRFLMDVPEFSHLYPELLRAYTDMTSDRFTLAFSSQRNLSKAVRSMILWMESQITMATEFHTLDPQLGRIGSTYARRILFYRHSLRQANIMEAFNESVYTVYGVYSDPVTDAEELGSAYKNHFGNIGPSGMSKSFLSRCLRKCMVNMTIDRSDSQSDGAHISADNRDKVVMYDEAPNFLIADLHRLAGKDYDRAQQYKTMMSEQTLSHSTTEYDPSTRISRGVTREKHVSLVIFWNSNQIGGGRDKSLSTRSHVHTASMDTDGACKVMELVGRTADGTDERNNLWFETYMKKEQCLTMTVFKMLGTRTIPFYPTIDLGIVYWQKVLAVLSAKDPQVYSQVRPMQRAIRNQMVRSVTDAIDYTHSSEMSPYMIRDQNTGEVRFLPHDNYSMMRTIMPALFAREDTVISDITSLLSQFFDPVVWEVVAYAAQRLARFKFEVPREMLRSLKTREDKIEFARQLHVQNLSVENDFTSGTPYMDMFTTEEMAIFRSVPQLVPGRQYFIQYDTSGNLVPDGASYKRYEDHEGAVFRDPNYLVIKGYRKKNFATLLANMMKKPGFDEETILYILNKAKDMKVSEYPYDMMPMYRENVKRRDGQGPEDVMKVNIPTGESASKRDFSVIYFKNAAEEKECEVHICTHFLRQDPDNKLRCVLQALSHKHTRPRYVVINRPVVGMPHLRQLWYLARNNRIFKVTNPLYINEAESEELYVQSGAFSLQCSKSRNEQAHEIDEDVEEYYARQHFKRAGATRPDEFDHLLPRNVDANIRRMYELDRWLRKTGKNLTSGEQRVIDDLIRQMEELLPTDSREHWMSLKPSGTSVKEWKDEFFNTLEKRCRLEKSIARARIRYPFKQIARRREEIKDKMKLEDEMRAAGDDIGEVLDPKRRFGLDSYNLGAEGVADIDVNDMEWKSWKETMLGDRRLYQEIYNIMQEKAQEKATADVGKKRSRGKMSDEEEGDSHQRSAKRLKREIVVDEDENPPLAMPAKKASGADNYRSYVKNRRGVQSDRISRRVRDTETSAV